MTSKQAAASRVPPLPAPPAALAADAAAAAQWRLRRLWDVLECPPLQRADMLLWICGGGEGGAAAATDPAARAAAYLDAWETAAAATLAREAALAELLKVRQACVHGCCLVLGEGRHRFRGLVFCRPVRAPEPPCAFQAPRSGCVTCSNRRRVHNLFTLRGWDECYGVTLEATQRLHGGAGVSLVR